MNGGLLCLKWRDHHSTFFRMLSSVRKKEMYCDATIACEGRFYPVHKLVLSTCSEYFERMFDVADKQHLMIVLADIPYENLETLLDFMYIGEVNVLQSDLSNFMKAAECLKIKGLAEPTETNPRKECVDSKRNLSQKDDGKRNLFQKDDGKRNLSQKDDGWETKRRRQNDDLLLNSRSETKTNEGILHDSSGSSKGLLGSKESCIESKRGRDQASGHGKINNISTLGIVSPAQLASAELASETQADSGSKSAAPLAKSHESSISHDGELTDCNSSQVKFEDVNVKEEPEEWLQTDSNEESQLFKFSDPGLTYMANTSTLPLSAQGLGQVVQSHVGALEHSAHPLPGPSGLHSTPGWDHQLHSTLTSDDFVQYQCGPVKGASQMSGRAKYSQYDKKTLQEALEAVCEGKMSQRQAAREYGVPLTTLHDRLTSRNNKASIVKVSLFTSQQETHIVNCFKQWTEAGFLRTRSDVQEVTHKLLRKHRAQGKSNPFKDDRPGRFWYQNFFRRHPELHLSSPDDLLAYELGASQHNARLWRENFDAFCSSQGFTDVLTDPSRIFTADETTFFVCSRAGIVHAPHCPKNVLDRTKGNVKSITVFMSLCADGQTLPGAIISPSGTRFKCDGSSAIQDWLMSETESGYMTAEIFQKYLTQVFMPWIQNAGVETPVWLFLDSRCSYLSPEVWEFCHKHHVILYALLQSSPQLPQPAAAAVFKPLEVSWMQMVQEQKQKGSDILTCDSFIALLKTLLANLSQPEAVKKAFKKSGLYPFQTPELTF
ncbi:uncharacterized protein [Procambarus clarkii]|uniref:uncharacterized protein isoform X1 n=1 Tax=Procambarus clarkii TaxID=6728 RepID=UPI001E672F53|nr:uncharacterized protein LOC123765801 isoform X1 [Procambarus clarkii]